MKERENLTYEEKLEELGLLHLKKRNLEIHVYEYSTRVQKRRWSQTFPSGVQQQWARTETPEVASDQETLLL